MWCVFFLKGGLLFFINYRSNRSISVRIVSVNYKLVRNVSEREFHDKYFLGKYLKCPERLFPHMTCSYLLVVLLFSQFQTIEKITFSQVWLISCSNFMYENSNVIVRTHGICLTITVKDI